MLKINTHSGIQEGESLICLFYDASEVKSLLNDSEFEYLNNNLENKTEVVIINRYSHHWYL
jgi:hypothetical protein